MHRVLTTLAAFASLAGGSALASQPLRLFHTADPCPQKPCTDWRVTDEADSRSFPAAVAFGRVRLARAVQAPALRGQVDILVDGDIRQVTTAGRAYMAVTVRKLTGVAPHSENLAAAGTIIIAQAAGVPADSVAGAPPPLPATPTPGPTVLPATPTPPVDARPAGPPPSPAAANPSGPATPPDIVAPGK